MVFQNEVVKDYLWTMKFDDINNKKLYDTCCTVEHELKKYLPPPPDDNGYGCMTSYYYKKYNLFQFPCPELHKLYSNMARQFKPLLGEGQWYLRTWVNLFASGKNIAWHKHWEPEYKTYHGFYCVNTEGIVPSYTEYQIPKVDKIVTVPSSDSLCVIGKSGDDLHRYRI